VPPEPEDPEPDEPDDDPLDGALGVDVEVEVEVDAAGVAGVDEVEAVAGAAVVELSFFTEL
jgi:hypothetical protein